MASKRWLVFDTETTGLPMPASAPLEQQPRIIEFALAVVEDRKILDEHSWLIHPEQSLPAEITKITGLTDSDLEGKPRFAEVLPQITEAFLGSHGLIAHNLPFDRTMLVNELRRCEKEYAFPYPPRQLCTVSAFMHLKGRRLKMLELYEILLGRPLAQTHRALDDVRALVEIVLAEEGLLE